MRRIVMLKGAALVVAMFWNLENYFDPFDDSDVEDEAFTPRGENHWTWKKFCKKRDDIAKVIISIGDRYGSFPAIIGVAEVENRFVMQQLSMETPLSRLDYEIIHRDSRDRRGIDVGVLYRKELFWPLYVKSFDIKSSSDSVLKTRSILYVKGILKASPDGEEGNGERIGAGDGKADLHARGDTVHVLVNHWPSKLGNKKISDKNRMAASDCAKHIADSILLSNPESGIILMGDLNDVPDSKPVKNLSGLINLAARLTADSPHCGTNKYRESWSLIDQILVSRSVERKNARMEIFSENLLVEDKTYLGYKPFRTLSGPRYIGGVSDHLPVVLIY